MALRRIFKNKKGFTLIEVLVVMGLLGVVLAFVASADLGTFRVASFGAERETLVTLLSRARANAINNIARSAHGVALSPPDHPYAYVLFRGSSYTSSAPQDREVYPMVYQSTFSSTTPSEIVFAPLDGTTAYEGPIVLEDPTRTTQTTISINKEGMID